MKVTRWTPKFNPDIESPLAPVWVVLEGLPIHLHNLKALYYIGILLDRPLSIDAHIANFSRPSLARLCIELNVSNPLPQKIWIENGNQGFFQHVKYENLPRYCSKCFRFDHETKSCSMKSSNTMHITDVIPSSDTNALEPNFTDSVPTEEKTQELNSFGPTSLDLQLPSIITAGTKIVATGVTTNDKNTDTALPDPVLSDSVESVLSDHAKTNIVTTGSNTAYMNIDIALPNTDISAHDSVKAVGAPTVCLLVVINDLSSDEPNKDERNMTSGSNSTTVSTQAVSENVVTDELVGDEVACDDQAYDEGVPEAAIDASEAKN
ncbi:unnamed protein product [Cuscuta europaea]|uniref:DUF4283 domain-containing protein n=1 Tax=Cuscuta europaea TaxID=41803 RepID=A0A9P0YSY6_CUSEU|nr:unnamed protein product [Cuscuta europaea]